MITKEYLMAHRKEILEIARRHGAQDVRIFGSVARGDQQQYSDLDLIVRFEPGRSLFDHGSLLMDLQELLQIKVDIISENGMRQRFREHVMKEAVTL